MISSRQILAKWCELNLSRFGFDKVEFRSMPPGNTLDKASLRIEHRHLLACFTAWGEQGTTEWLVLDSRNGEITISRDENFADEAQFTVLIEKAMGDIRACDDPPKPRPTG